MKRCWNLVGHARATLLVLAIGSALVLSACASPNAQTQADTAATQEQKQQDESVASDVQEEPAPPEDEASEEAIVWPDECLDRHGDATVYAVTELTGEQLCSLLEGSDYEWSERNRLWVKMDGSSALAVRDKDGEPLKNDKIAELNLGAIEGATSYRLVTSRYSTAKKVVNSLVRDVMTLEDVEYLEDGGVAVATGPSGQRCLVFVTKASDVFTANVYSELAVAAGLFNQDAGQDLGATIDEVFEALTGRMPAAE